MHLISLALLRFVEYMSAVYIEEEFGDLYQPEDTYEYWRSQVKSFVWGVCFTLLKLAWSDELEYDQHSLTLRY